MNDAAFKKFDLSGKSALVTGGSAGLGFHAAMALVSSGANVTIAARREEQLKDAFERLSKHARNNRVTYSVVDLEDRADVDRMAREVIARHGGVDIFIGNAGLRIAESIDNINETSNDRVFQVNVTANMTLVRHLLPHMRAKKWGRVIFSSSIASKVSATLPSGAYGTSKGAINAYTRFAAASAGRDGITVNSIVLGIFMTDMVASAHQSSNQQNKMLSIMENMSALGRIGRAEELEGLIQYLASDASGYMTGNEIIFDGGVTIMMRPHEA